MNPQTKEPEIAPAKPTGVFGLAAKIGDAATIDDVWRAVLMQQDVSASSVILSAAQFEVHISHLLRSTVAKSEKKRGSKHALLATWLGNPGHLESVLARQATKLDFVISSSKVADAADPWQIIRESIQALDSDDIESALGIVLDEFGNAVSFLLQHCACAHSVLPYAQILAMSDAADVSLWQTTSLLSQSPTTVTRADEQDPHAIPCAMLSPSFGLPTPLRAMVCFATSVLALRYSVLPPSLASVPVTGRFYQNKSKRPWFAFTQGQPLIAAIGSADLQPTIVLGQREEVKDLPAWPKVASAFTTSELLMLSANSRTELISRIAELRTHLPRSPAQIAKYQGDQDGKFRIAIAGVRTDTFAGHLTNLEKIISRDAPFHIGSNDVFFADSEYFRDSKVAFLYPGQGSAYPGMLRDLTSQFPSVRRWFDYLDASSPFGKPGSRSLFPHYSPADAEYALAVERVNAPEVGAPAGMVASMALDELIRALGITPDVLVGYSNGEIAALILSGALPFSDRRQIFTQTEHLRGESEVAERHGRLPKGKWLSVSAIARADVEAIIDEYPGRAFLAMENCRSQMSVFVTPDVTDSVIAKISRGRGICLRLPFERAYHTPLFAKQAEKIREVYRSLELQSPQFPVYSCATASPFPAEAEETLNLAAQQWCSPVRFRETIERLYADGVRIFIEVGAGAILTGYVRDTLRGREHVAVPCDVPGRDGIKQLQIVAAVLFVCGRSLDTTKFYSDHGDTSNPRDTNENDAALDSPASFHLGALATDALVPETLELALASEGSTIIVKRHFELMNDFLEAQKRMLLATINKLKAPGQSLSHTKLVSGNEGPHVPASASAQANGNRGRSYPLLGKTISRSPGSAKFERIFSLAIDPYLRDHTFGRVLDQPSKTALPILPFTITMELMAEAAKSLAGGDLILRAMHEVRAYRWLALDREHLSLQIHAQTQSTARTGNTMVDVSVYEMKDGMPDREPGALLAFKCTVEFASTRLLGESLLSRHDGEPSSSRFSGADFYKLCVFHGPSFHSIQSARYVDKGAIETEVQVPSARGVDELQLQTPAFLLDVAGQSVAYWLVELGHRFFGEFPFEVKRYLQFQPAPNAGTKLTCVTSCEFNGTTSTANVEFIDTEGHPVARFEQLISRHYQFDRGYLSSIYWPGKLTLSERVGELARPDIEVRCISGVCPEMQETSADIWLRALAHVSLVENECATWYALPESGPRRLEWLLGRIAAKEAVCVWATENLGLKLSLLQIVISNDDLGCPIASINDQVMYASPQISISHSGTLVLAAAAPANCQVGIDIEFQGNRNWENLDGGFTPEELRLWPTSLGPPLPLWCAKEAAAKASGRGLEGAWHNWTISEVSPDGREVIVQHEGDSYEVSLTAGADEVMAICIRR